MSEYVDVEPDEPEPWVCPDCGVAHFRIETESGVFYAVCGSCSQRYQMNEP